MRKFLLVSHLLLYRDAGGEKGILESDQRKNAHNRCILLLGQRHWHFNKGFRLELLIGYPFSGYKDCQW